MARDEQLKERWEAVVSMLSNRFADGEVLDLDAIIYLVGLQELGQTTSGRVYIITKKLYSLHQTMRT